MYLKIMDDVAAVHVPVADGGLFRQHVINGRTDVPRGSVVTLRRGDDVASFICLSLGCPRGGARTIGFLEVPSYIHNQR